MILDQFESKLPKIDFSKALKTNCGLNNGPFIARKKSVINGVTILSKKMIDYLRNVRPLKIRLLQCYEVLWILVKCK